MASTLPHQAKAVAVDRSSTRYAPAIAAAVAVLGILAAHAETAASIVAIWKRSETFAHGFLVIPIALWLAWRERRHLLAVPARPWSYALMAVAASGGVWFVASLADVVSGRQFALAFMLQAAIVAVVGIAVARAAALPLLFLLFAVPAGEFLLPTLIDWTADFTIAALRLSGVPVFREANHFVIPTGAWSVVEACSGLRYLIASMMIGVLYAAVCYRSAWRRAAFLAASIAVPLVANWLRAYMIVMLGHLSNNRLAVGVDHLVYGWLFFGIVMALLFWVASFWSEPQAGMPTASAAGHRATTPVREPPHHFFAVAIAAIVLAMLWRPLLALFDEQGPTATPTLAAIAATKGFVPVDNPVSSWTPAYGGHSATFRQSFVKGDVAGGLYIAYYRDQAKGRELVTTANQLVAVNDDVWREVARSPVALSFADEATEAVRSVVRGGGERLVVYRLYWIDGALTASDYVLKARLAWSKLRGHGDDAALVVFYARENERNDAAREAFEALMPGVLRMLSETKRAR
jgi:exosortase A